MRKAEWTISEEHAMYRTNCANLFELIGKYEKLTSQKGVLLPQMYSTKMYTIENGGIEALLSQVEKLLGELTGQSIIAQINVGTDDLGSQHHDVITMSVHQRIGDSEEDFYPAKNLGTIPLKRQK